MDVLELLKIMMDLLNKQAKAIQKLCPHKIVRVAQETRIEGKNYYSGLECKVCEKWFLTKPKGSKISRMQEVLSDK